MNQKNKKILKIILIILIIILVGLLVWLFLIKPRLTETPSPGYEPGDVTEPPIPGGVTPEPPIPGTGEPGGGEPGGEPGGGITPGGGSPDGGQTPPPGTITPTPGTSGSGGAFKPILRRVSEKPIAGSVIFNKGGRQFIRFADRATGHIYETDAEIIRLDKITNTTVPKVYEAIFQGDASGAIYRYLKEDNSINSFAGSIRNPGPSGEFRGQFLSTDIKSLDVSKTDGALLFVKINPETGFGSLSISSFFGNNQVEIWQSPLSEWLPIFSKNGTPAIISKASESSQGTLIVFNRNGTIRDYLVNGIYGLSVSLSPDGQGAIYSDAKNKPISLWLKKVGEEKISLPIKTLGEKCDWADSILVFCAVPEGLPIGEYPDSWYQGTLSFKDSVYQMNLQNKNLDYIINLSNASGFDFDVDQIMISPDKRFITLRNKNDLILWSLQVKP